MSYWRISDALSDRVALTSKGPLPPHRVYYDLWRRGQLP